MKDFEEEEMIEENDTQEQPPQHEEEFDVVNANMSVDGLTRPVQERLTTPYMTKYERARILGTRALQIR